MQCSSDTHISSKDFWKRGLCLAWGDPNRVSDSDFLRFQWPSIGKGWEQGLLRFKRVQMMTMKNVNDSSLFQQVLNRLKTRLVVLRGNQDHSVTKSMLDTFFVTFQALQVIELDGLGHNPFEGDVERFISTLDEWCTV
jgi:pimeloyl-ACP methyl ester carboxylesterase